MSNVLILSNKTQILTDLSEMVDTKMEVHTALLNSGNTIDLDTSFRPNCIAVFIENVNRQRLFGIMDLRENEEYKYIPMLVIGSKEDIEVFENNVTPGADMRLPAHATRAEIRIAIEKLASNVEPEEKKLLVIDDDPVFLRMMRTYLQDNYMVTTVKSGKLAMKYLEKQNADLIVLDYLMPDWDGSMTFQMIRSYEPSKNIPIIFLTGVTDKEKVMECITLKPQGYLVKPISKPELLAKIKQVLNRKKDII